MPTRMAGISGYFDTEALVKASLEPYKLKVTNKEKEMKLLELKQTQYRDILTKTQDFYNKYLTNSNSNGLMTSSSYKSVSFSSTDEGAVTAKALSGAAVSNYSVKVNQIAAAATKSYKDGDLTSGKTITINNQNFVLNGATSKDIAKDLNTQISSYNSKITDTSKKIDVTVQYSDFAITDGSNNAIAGVVIKSNTLGEDAKFTISYNGGAGEEIKGKNADVEITNSQGMIKKYTGNTNSVTYDNVQFIFNSKTLDTNGNATTAKITGKSDVTGLKDKIVSFINDYNTIIKNLNTKLSEKRDKTYMPLTSDEKKDMNENDIKLWEEKINQGLLRRDNDIQRIADSMKSSMRTMMSDTGLKLESIGIKPVQDYKTANGTFTIDEDTLTAALQNNTEGVRQLFTRDATSNNNYQDGGVLTTLKAVFDKEIMTASSSALIKKAGLPGSINDDMSKQLDSMQAELTDMNDSLTERENNLYTKYAQLESAISKLNSQQESLTQQLGI